MIAIKSHVHKQLQNSIFGFMSFEIILYFPVRSRGTRRTEISAPFAMHLEQGAPEMDDVLYMSLFLKKLPKSKKCNFREHLE